MSDQYLNIYNNLIKLTRNKSLYIKFKSENETFSDRMVFLLLHFLFFLKFIKTITKKIYKKFMI